MEFRQGYRLPAAREPCYTPSMDEDFKAVILHGFKDEEALAAMRAVKALLKQGAGSTAFATTTPTSMGWKVSELLEHLAEEQAMMRERIGRA